MNYSPDAIREVFVALLQVIPALLIAYLLLDPPFAGRSTGEIDKRIQRRMREVERGLGRLEPGREWPGPVSEPAAAIARLQRERDRPAARFATVVLIALAGLLLAVNGILGIRISVLAVYGLPDGVIELLLSLAVVMILVSQIAIAGTERIAGQHALDRVHLRGRIYGFVAAAFFGWIIVAALSDGNPTGGPAPAPTPTTVAPPMPAPTTPPGSTPR